MFLDKIDLTSLYILTAVFLGFGFSHKSKWFLLSFCSLAVVIRSLQQDGEFDDPIAIFTRLCTYLIMTFISSNVVRKYYEVKKRQKELVLALAKSLDSRDNYTANHSKNVANYSLRIAREMKLSNRQCEAIIIGGLLHDIGKIGVPKAILTKSSRLTNDEFDEIKRHPVIGYEILKHISSFRKNGVLDMVLYHHERYDGKGYPYGLKGEEIPLVARIMSVADSFDAMTSKHVYRNALDLEHVIKEINNHKGTQYDPEIADVFLRMLKREDIEIIPIKKAT
jgi:putative nucleotidyltransferase with HDIG domain